MRKKGRAGEERIGIRRGMRDCIEGIVRRF